MDERVRWVVVAVKHWAVTLNLINNDFSSFSLIWLVLFVMMLYQIVPPIIHLWKMQNNNESHYTEGNIMFVLNFQFITINLTVYLHLITRIETILCSNEEFFINDQF